MRRGDKGKSDGVQIKLDFYEMPFLTPITSPSTDNNDDETSQASDKPSSSGGKQSAVCVPQCSGGRTYSRKGTKKGRLAPHTSLVNRKPKGQPCGSGDDFQFQSACSGGIASESDVRPVTGDLLEESINMDAEEWEDFLNESIRMQSSCMDEEPELWGLLEPTPLPPLPFREGRIPGDEFITVSQHPGFKQIGPQEFVYCAPNSGSEAKQHYVSACESPGTGRCSASGTHMNETR
jgi:hypothetical protein